MAADTQLRDGFTVMLRSVDAPVVPLEKIHRCMHAQHIAQSDRRPLAIAAAAVLLVAIAFPIASPGVVQTLEEKIAAILHWTPPAKSRPPAAVWEAMKPQTVSLNEAQARVHFTIVIPAGVPLDAGAPAISVAPTGVYSPTTHTWSVGPAIVTFTYKREGGHAFGLSAASASSQTSPPSRYMFEDRGVDKAGNPILVRHDRLVWRNGDQLMTAIAGEGITRAEIVAIRSAMHGSPVPGVWPPQHGRGATMVRVLPPH